MADAEVREEINFLQNKKNENENVNSCYTTFKKKIKKK